jgi:hypothetical protein
MHRWHDRPPLTLVKRDTSSSVVTPAMATSTVMHRTASSEAPVAYCRVQSKAPLTCGNSPAPHYYEQEWRIANPVEGSSLSRFESLSLRQTQVRAGFGHPGRSARGPLQGRSEPKAVSRTPTIARGVSAAARGRLNEPSLANRRRWN